MNKNEEMKCLAIDMGASNIRVMLGTISSDNLDFEEIHRFPNTPIMSDGHERWDIEFILQEILKGIAKASASHEKIMSLGVDAWGVDYALLDKQNRLTGLPIAYRDQRTEGMMEKWESILSREETFSRTGINFYIFNTLFQVLSDIGKGIHEAEKLLFLPSYVLYRLCGIGLNESTISSTSQMLSAETGNWDVKILENLEISEKLMGRVCEPGTILGKVNQSGLNLENTEAIAVCGHDTASAVVSVPFGNESSVFISTGTWCIVGIESDHPILTEEALKEGFTNERGYGGTFRFLKNIVGLWLVQGLMKSLPVGDDYSEIEALALEYEGEMNIINPGDPIFYNPENMKETFDEYFKKTGQKTPGSPGGYFRAAYNSLIFSFRRHIELIEQMTGEAVSTIHLIGGGCQSNYLTSQTAVICNRKVVSGPVEAATIGNILVQAISMEKIQDIREARELVGKTMSIESILPPGESDPQYSGYQKFLDLIEKY